MMYDISCFVWCYSCGRGFLLQSRLTTSWSCTCGTHNRVTSYSETGVPFLYPKSPKRKEATGLHLSSLSTRKSGGEVEVRLRVYVLVGYALLWVYVLAYSASHPMIGFGVTLATVVLHCTRRNGG